MDFFLFCTTNLLGLHSKCPTVLRPLPNIQKLLFIQTADTVVSAVNISKTSITFLSILFLLPYKKEKQSKNGLCYRKTQDVPSAIKHERNWVHLKVLSSRYSLRKNSNKCSKIIFQLMGVFKYGTFEHFSALSVKSSQAQDLEIMPFNIILFNLIEKHLTQLNFPDVKGIISLVRAMQGNQIQFCILPILSGIPLKQTPRL